MRASAMPRYPISISARRNNGVWNYGRKFGVKRKDISILRIRALRLRRGERLLLAEGRRASRAKEGRSR
jgi:hypothetical protein